MQTQKTKNSAIQLPPNHATDFHFWYKNVTKLHYHDYYEIFIITKGITLHTLNDTVKQLEKNCVGIIRPGEKHKFSFAANHKSEHICISIRTTEFSSLCDLIDTFFSSALLQSPVPLFFMLNEKEFDFLLYLAKKIQALDNDFYKEKSEQLIKLMVFTLITIYKEKLNFNKAIPDWLKSFLEKLSTPDYFCRPLQELYPLSGYSHSTLNKLFQQYMGETMISYITKKKITYACNLLRTTNFSVLYISNLLAYESLAHFNRTFKKITGITPAAYRKPINQGKKELC